MKDIYWKKLNWYNKIAYIIGWLGILNIWFWIILSILYYSKNEERKIYQPLFNPHTKKVIYVFGWIYLICFILGLFFIIITY